MRKKRLVTLLLPSLLLAPLVLAQAVQADEATQASSERTDNLKTETVAKASETGSQDQQSTAVETASQTSSEDSVQEKQDKPPLAAEGTVPSLSPAQEQELVALAKDVSSAPSAGSTAVKGQDLSAYTGGLSNPSLADKEITLQEAVDELLKWAAVSDSQLGSSAGRS